MGPASEGCAFYSTEAREQGKEWSVVRSDSLSYCCLENLFTLFYKNITQEMWCTLSVPALGRQRQVDHFEFEAGLVYI